MEVEKILELNKKYDEELVNIIADPCMCLLYGSRSVNPDGEDISRIKQTLYREIYEGKNIFDKCSFEKI